MDMKDLLSKMTQLNEAKEANYSPSYRVGKTGDFSDKPHMKRGTPVAGKVGKYGKTSDELGDPDQDPDDDTPASSEKRGRGRPKKAGGAADTKDKYSGAKDLQNVMIGKMPKTLPGKKGTVHKSPQDKEVNESTKKKSLKDWVERVEQVIAENTAMPTTTSTATAPSASQKVMVKPGQPAGQKPPATMTTQTGQTIAVGSADQVKKLGDLVNTGQVQLTKPGTTQPLDEEGMEEGDEKWIKGAIKHPGAFTKKAKSHGMSTSSFANKVLSNKEDYPASTEKQANLAKTLGKFRKKTDEADIPPNDSLMSPISEAKKKADAAAKKDDKAEKAGKKVAKDIEYDEKVKDSIHGKKRGAEDNKAERAGKKVAKDIEYDMKKKTVKEAAKPDFPDIDNDGNTKESMKKAAADKKKKAVKEGRDHHLKAAYHEGKAHGLSKQPYNCRHDDMEEARQYHEGYKCGLDECYGQQPILGYVGEESQHDVVDTMASYGAHGLEEGLDPIKRARLDQLIDQFHAATEPGGAWDFDEMDDEEVIAQIRQEFGDKIADQVASGSHKMHYGRQGMQRSDPLGWKKGNQNRVTKAGKLFKQDSDFMKNTIKSRYRLGGRSATESVAEDEMEEGNAFTGMLAKTPKGGKFSFGGKTFTDTSNIDEMAFESLDKQLNALLNEGVSVSISQGQQGAPNSVNVNATDAEADKLLAFVKQAGLGIFGGDAGSSESSMPADKVMDNSRDDDAEIAVVDDHDDMLSLIRKMTGQGPAKSSDDYEDEESHSDHEGTCSTCHSDPCECDEQIDEVQSEDQMTYEVAEDDAVAQNAANIEAGAEAEAAADKSEEAETSADEHTEAEEDMAIGASHGGNGKTYGGEEEELEESYANAADDDFEADINFMTKVISGGLNKQKSTGQTTIPVISGQTDRMGYSTTNESITDWKKLAGLK
jgi:hypothetical protein